MQVPTEHNCKKGKGQKLDLICRQKDASLTTTNLNCWARSPSPILQVGIKPGQLVAVHQVLGMAKVGQRISVVAQVRQSISMVVGTFHHRVQQGVLAISCWVGAVGSIL